MSPAPFCSPRLGGVARAGLGQLGVLARQVLLVVVLEHQHVELGGDRRTEGPGDPLAHIVGGRLAAAGAHVAGGAGRTGEILFPGAPGRAVQLQLLAESAVKHPVLGLVPDLHLRVVRPEVALAAALGLAGLGTAELVAGMAGGAGAPGAVGVDPPHPGVGPGVRGGPAALIDFDQRAVALAATGDHRRRAAHHLAQQVVQRAEDLPGLGMVRALLLLDFLGVAAPQSRGETIAAIVAP